MLNNLNASEIYILAIVAVVILAIAFIGYIAFSAPSDGAQSDPKEEQRKLDQKLKEERQIREEVNRVMNSAAASMSIAASGIKDMSIFSNMSPSERADFHEFLRGVSKRAEELNDIEDGTYRRANPEKQIADCAAVILDSIPDKLDVQTVTRMLRNSNQRIDLSVLRAYPGFHDYPDIECGFFWLTDPEMLDRFRKKNIPAAESIEKLGHYRTNHHEMYRYPPEFRYDEDIEFMVPMHQDLYYCVVAYGSRLDKLIRDKEERARCDMVTISFRARVDLTRLLAECYDGVPQDIADVFNPSFPEAAIGGGGQYNYTVEELASRAIRSKICEVLYNTARAIHNEHVKERRRYEKEMERLKKQFAVISQRQAEFRKKKKSIITKQQFCKRNK